MQRLVSHGHNFLQIPDYTLQQVVILLDAIEKHEAANRASFLTDLAAAIGGVLGGSEMFSEHLEDMTDIQFEDG